MKKARLIYYKEYPPFNEGYAIEILVNGEWELESFYALQHCIIDEPTDERNFIHHSILVKLSRLVDLGYTIHLL